MVFTLLVLVRNACLLWRVTLWSPAIFLVKSIGVTVAKLALVWSVLVVQLRSCPEFWCSKQAISLTSNVYMKIKEWREGPEWDSSNSINIRRSLRVEGSALGLEELLLQGKWDTCGHHTMEAKTYVQHKMYVQRGFCREFPIGFSDRVTHLCGANEIFVLLFVWLFGTIGSLDTGIISP